MDRRLVLAAVVAALADQLGEPMRPTACAARIGERTLTGPVVEALVYLQREGIVEAVSAHGHLVGYRLAADARHLGPSAQASVRAAGVA